MERISLKKTWIKQGKMNFPYNLMRYGPSVQESNFDASKTQVFGPDGPESVPDAEIEPAVTLSSNPTGLLGSKLLLRSETIQLLSENRIRARSGRVFFARPLMMLPHAATEKK